MDPDIQKQVADFYRRALAEGASEQQALSLAGRFAQERGGPAQPQPPADPGLVEIERPGVARGLLSTALQGVTLGFGDEIGAGIKAAGTLLPGGRPASEFKQAYSENVEAAREGLAATREDRPKLSLVSEIAGAVAPAVLTAGASGATTAAATGARAAPTIGRLAASGAALGAVDAAGRAEGGVVDRLPEAGVGAVVGGALGAALPFVGKGLARVGSSLGLRVRGPQTRAADEILDALDEAPGLVRGRLTGAADETLMDVAPGARSLGETAALYPGARETFEEMLEGRARQQFPRVQQAIEGGTGLGRENSAALADQIVQTRRAASRPLYQQAYARGQIPVSPELAQILQKPSIQMAFERAQRIAAEEGADLGEIGLAEGARSFRTPTVQAIDYIKRGLDDVLYVGKRPEGGLGPAMLHEIQNTRSALLNEVDRLVPEYAAARAEFAGFSAMKDALEVGRSRFHLDPPAELARLLDDMGPSEVEMFRRGAVDNVLHRLGSVPDRNDLMKRLVQSPNEVQRMALLFDDPNAYQGFLGRMGAMAEQGVTRDAVLKGSPTARRLTGREALEGTGVGSSFSPRTLLDEIATGRRQGVGEATAEELAGMLTRTGADLPTLLELLEGRAATRGGLGLAARAGTNVGALQSSRLLTPLLFPEEGGGPR